MNKLSKRAAALERLKTLGLSELWREIFHPGSPLAFLTAQGLRVAQPVLGAFTGDDEIGALADRLEAPDDEVSDV